MKRRNETRRSGVVLLLILGLMSMFALSVLTYMIVTSNMAETAQNSAKIDAVVEVPAQADVGAALKTLVIGSNNERNPIGPFSILENMYGDWTEVSASNNRTSENVATQFPARLALFPNLGYAILTPCENVDGDTILPYDRDGNSFSVDERFARQEMTELFENSGGVLTFQEAYDFPDENTEDLWNKVVSNTSAFVLEKVVTNPTNARYSKNGSGTTYDGQYWEDHYFDNLTANSNNKNSYWACDYWHFKVEASDDLKRFANDYCNGNVSNIENFNTSGPIVFVRLNRPPYSGTGAGGFTPGEAKDAQVTPDMASDLTNFNAADFRIPFAFWGNAAAPDLYPFYKTENSKLSFRAYWAHLLDVNYDSAQYDADGSMRYAYLNGSSWNSNNPVSYGFSNGAYLEPVRMNPSYTAPDFRTMFLARYDGPMTVNLGGSLPAITPSFHRPALFQTLVDGGYFGYYQNLYDEAKVKSDAIEPLLTALVRKLTPRPLPNDHWKFDGGNHYLDYYNGSSGVMTASDIASRLSGGADYQWDVDNDGDGVREGIWIPSGLPVRVDKNGTPYATMFSYTVLDLDGRINVNTAGNWDQLPNKLGTQSRFDVDGNTYNDNLQPYSYVDELASINSVGVDTNSPFYNADSLKNSFGWRDDHNNLTDVAVRGDGRGTSGVLLYEGLASIFNDHSVYVDENGKIVDDVLTFAANLIWRRNLSTRDDATGKVDQANLSWSVNDKFNSQPGYVDFGKEVDDALATRQEFFRFTDPLRLYDDEGRNGSSATLGEAKMLFPWRGKTTIYMGTIADLAPGFDYANTAFRSYDPLGAQIFTYAPNYSNNPYWVSQYVSTWQDSPYTLSMLERMLRPFDSDVAATPSQLVDDLGLNSDLYGSTNRQAERARARQSLTTISSDVPSPSLVFPENKPLEDGEYRAGHFGFVDLIRRCVRCELYRVFKQKDIYQAGVDADGVEIPGSNVYLETGVNADLFNAKVEEITAYLATLLPREIMAGEKIDLNALSQKNYWLDVTYDSNGNLIASANSDDDGLHNVGLVKRMEYARGLYLVMMTLLYEDMNAKDLYPSDDAEGAEGEGAEGEDVEKKLADYVEGSFDLLKYKKEAKGLMARELTATRIAQWCINVVDFSDPDATMTPFYFDPTPFDGWWVQDSEWIDDPAASTNGYNRWKIGEEIQNGETTLVNPGWDANDNPEIHFLFSPNNGSPKEQMEAFFLDALNNSEDSLDDVNKFSVYRDYEGNESVETDSDGNVVARKRSNRLIAEWMTKPIKKLEDQASDLGFRVAWGMERPDLLLTETLNFHDLGIADTKYEGDLPSTEGQQGQGNTPRTRKDGDDSFDQVKRPQGSTYLELYCTANPNVPQSPELYDYVDGVWQLHLSKKTPIYKDSANRELEMPVWRVAIGASSDPRGLSVEDDREGKDEEEKNQIKEANEKLKKSNKVVYRKARNSVLEWLTPHKDGDDYKDDISFFSLQTRQFRNLPTPLVAGGTKIEKISDYDLDQGLDEDGKKVKELDATKRLGDWVPFNVSSSNLLGAAITAKDEDARTREIELDRIVWFNHAEGDDDNNGGVNLGTAGKYPDALRTFCNADPSGKPFYLEPNQYLIVGPNARRSVCSMPYEAVKNIDKVGRFGKNPPEGLTAAWLNLEEFGKSTRLAGRCKHMVVRANIGESGLNISEPLWTAMGTDPFPIINPDYEEGPEKACTNGVQNVVYDIPFELPPQWAVAGSTYDPKKYSVEDYPIIQDELFGVGTVPAYKSAFVQRVADPNRPYHPLMNPYITVDWNVMDLIVYTGECNVSGGAEVENQWAFTGSGNYPFRYSAEDDINKDNNRIYLAKNGALGLDKDKEKLSYSEVFSSRQWGSEDQKAFGPTVGSSVRPNPWARAFKADGEKAGLQSPEDLTKSSDPTVVAAATTSLAVPFVPKHTLGVYNNRGAWGTWGVDENGNPKFAEDEVAGNTYKGLNENFLVGGGVYSGAPRTPFEHLVWNDAPFSNVMELALVPASAPGRFGLEFVRQKDKGQFELADLYKVDSKKKSSLGSFGVYGFTDWYNDENVKVVKKGETEAKDDDELKKLKDKAGALGAYLNFFVSSKTPGETLNLCKVFEFVHTPSWFLGTKSLAGRDSAGYLISDSNGNAEFRSKRREPGKININTLTKPAWQAISPSSERVDEGSRLPGTTWEEFQEKGYPYSTEFVYDNNGNQVYDTDADGNQIPQTQAVGKGYCYFQPANTLALWTQLDKSEAPVPTFTTLLAQQDCDLSESNSVEEEPLFDNVKDRYEEDANGDTLYSYKDPNTGEVVQTTDVSSVPEGTTYTEVKTQRRNNLFEATAEMQRLSGLTTMRSNVFAAWVTVGYFEVERCQPGVNMPNVDPDGNALTVAALRDSNYKWYQYYQAVYPDGYTYGKELGSDFGETKRRRGFAIIDRSVPVDFRRGNSANYKDAVLLQRIIN